MKNQKILELESTLDKVVNANNASEARVKNELQVEYNALFAADKLLQESIAALKSLIGLSSHGIAKEYRHENSEVETILEALKLIAKVEGRE